MTGTNQLQVRRLPRVWATYPWVLLTKRPPIADFVEPPEIVASVAGVLLDAAHVQRYAEMCGFGPGTELPITFPHVLSMPLHLKIFALGAFPLRPMGLIHLSNTIESPGTLTAGTRVDVAVAARNYQRTDAGVTFDMDTDVSSGGQTLWKETCVFLARWPESMARAGARPPRPPKAPKDSAVLVEFDVTRETAWAYARVSSDFNPIHLSDRAARFFGLRGSIGHGMWSLARTLAQAPAAVIPGGAVIGTQFLSPVQLPGRVAIKEWRDEGQAKRALCDVRTGRVHMYVWWDAVTPTA